MTKFALPDQRGCSSPFSVMDTLVISALLPPGELSGWDFASIIGVYIAFCVLPIVIIAFIIYWVVVEYSRASDGVTLRLDDRRQKDF